MDKWAISVLARQDMTTTDGRVLHGVMPKRIIVGSGNRAHFDAVLAKTPEQYKKTVARWLKPFLEGQPMRRGRFQEDHRVERGHNVILLIEKVELV